MVESGIANKQRDNAILGRLITFGRQNSTYRKFVMHAAEYILTVLQKWYIREKTDYRNYRDIIKKGIKSVIYERNWGKTPNFIFNKITTQIKALAAQKRFNKQIYLHNIFYRQYSLSFSCRKISHHNFGKFLCILILSFQ